MTDSYLVKSIKKLERIERKARANRSGTAWLTEPEGRVAETLDHIGEVAYEAKLQYEEEKKEEELEKIREKHGSQKKPREVQTMPGLDEVVTTNVKVPWWKRILRIGR